MLNGDRQQVIRVSFLLATLLGLGADDAAASIPNKLADIDWVADDAFPVATASNEGRMIPLAA